MRAMLRCGSVVLALPRVISSCAFAPLPFHPLATALLRGRPLPSQALNNLCGSVSDCAYCLLPFDVPPFWCAAATAWKAGDASFADLFRALAPSYYIYDPLLLLPTHS